MSECAAVRSIGMSKIVGGGAGRSSNGGRLGCGRAPPRAQIGGNAPADSDHMADTVVQKGHLFRTGQR
jgi:hypothetical protein